ncbi:MAG: imidazoleglycerol-phosphate dehydratase [Candidatus Omnitrophica bacterium]|nr:imidazoleglycerol-phosphate dehydratase [Candidatus Omnitrophota bacterium]
MKKRTAEKNRETKETNIKLKLAIDGSGKSSINTGIGFLDHMLELFAFHGLFDLEITATGDLKVDIHHTNEDIGIVLGDAFKEALGDKKGIKRISSAAVPMEDVVANVTADISGRGSLKLERPGDSMPQADDKEGYALNDAEHFFEAFAKRLGVNLNITVDPLGKDLHTTLEPVFKALGLAMDAATQIDPRRTGIPSTKGIID